VRQSRQAKRFNLSIIQIPTLGKKGRLGNWLNLYTFARRLAESSGAILETPDWVGRRMFDLKDPLIESVRGRQFEFEEKAIYHPTYSIEDFRRYLPMNPHIKVLASIHAPYLAVHIRRGDFMISDLWPQVPLEVIEAGVRGLDLPWEQADLYMEEKPHKTLLPLSEPYMIDFCEMVLAKHLVIYPASSFSGFASMLNENNVYLPYDYKFGKTHCKWRQR
jgi:hypothetical protein